MMTTATSSTLTRYLRQVLRTWDNDDRPDAELLSLFARTGDDQAFATLVRRYSVVVWGVCYRILGHREEAEDAFQATFLVLARKAGQIGRKELVGHWLYGVAQRTAWDVRKTAARRQRHEKQASTMTPATYTDDASRPDLLAVLDEEILKLPETYRVPIVLCRLEGQTYAEAAQALGCSTAAVGRRVARAEELLRDRLVRRGVVLAGTSLAALLTRAVTASGMSVSLVGDTLQAAREFAAGTLAPSQAAAVARGVLQAMGGTKIVFYGVVCVALVGAALALVAQVVPQAQGDTPTTADAPPARAEAARLDRHGDPLPDGALARLGTVRWRQGASAHFLAFTPNGRGLLAAGQGDPARLWDVATGRLLSRFGDNGENRIQAAALSPDGRVLAARVAAGDLCLWDVASRKPLWRVTAARLGSAVPLAFSPDGKAVASVDGGKVRLWEAATGKELWAVPANRGQQAVTALAFVADGKALIGGDRNGSLCLWDTATGEERRRWDDEHKRPVSALAAGPDGRLFAAYGPARGVGGLARLWDVTAEKEAWRLEDEAAKDLVAAAFSPDGKVLATGGLRAPVRLWDAATGKEIRRCDGSTSAVSLAFAPDGKTLASGGWGGFGGLGDPTVRLWDVATGRQVPRDADGHQAAVCSVAFSADGRDVVATSWEGSVRVWDAATGEQRRRITPSGEHFIGGATSSVASATSSDGKTIASATWDRVEPTSSLTVRLWDAASGRESGSWTKELGKWAAHTLAFSPDGKTVACALWKASPDDQVHRWETATGKELSPVAGGYPAFSPDGKLLATAPFGGRKDGPGSFTLWDAATAENLCSATVREGRVHRLLFSPDGRMLATASNMAGNQQSVIHLWPLIHDDAPKSGVRIGSPRVLAAGLRSLLAAETSPYWFGAWAFSPDGRMLAITEGGTVRLLETASGKERAHFAGHGEDVAALAFAPDGRRLASGSRDTTVLVWDLTGRLRDGQPRPARLTDDDLEKAWADLASDDAARAGTAVWGLAADPERAAPYLGRRLRATAADAKALMAEVPQLIRDLDDDEFSVRQKARAELTRLGAAAEPALRHALAQSPSAEVRQSLEQLLKGAPPSGESFREGRAVEVLEQIGAREVLKALTADAAGTPMGDEARVALDRLGRAERP